MENNQLANQSSQFSKQKIVEYVGQMEEIESREFALRKTAEKLRAEAKKSKAKADERISFYKNNISFVKQLSERAEKHCQEAINPPKMMNEIQEDNWEEEYNEEKWALRDEIKFFKNNQYSGFLMGEPERVKKSFDERGHKVEKEPFKLDIPQKPENYEEMKKTKEPNLPLFDPFGFVLGALLVVPLAYALCIMGLSLIGGMIGTFIEKYIENFLEFWIIPICLIYVLSLVICLPMAIAKDRKWWQWHNKYGEAVKYDKEIPKYNTATQKYEAIYLPLYYLYESFRYEIDQAEKNKEADEKYYNQFEEMAKFLEKQADIIAEQKKEMYKISIVPPAYRTLDCLIMVKSIFENDLADTMREAIMIYEDRVFKGIVVTGIQKIYEMLGKLAYSMKAVEDHLLVVRDEVSQMSRNVFTLSVGIGRAADAQEDWLEEARATKYAIESIERSNQLLLLHQNRINGNYYV